MTMTTLSVPAALMRGGTSKCWIFDKETVDSVPIGLDLLLENAFGAGDHRQIDGVGGATSTTSKAAVVWASAEDDVDVEYLFGQVGVGDRIVEWGSNCGNCATAVGLYAVQNGLVSVEGDWTSVRMRNANTGVAVEATVATPGGIAVNEGITSVPGVRFGGVAVDLTFLEPFHGGGVLLPTGHPSDVVTVAEVTGTATVIDAGAKALLIDAQSVGLTGAEDDASVTRNVEFLRSFRMAGAALHGIIRPDGSVPNAVPKTGLVGPPRDYLTLGGEGVKASDYDVSARMLSMNTPHPAIGLTSAVAFAVAAATAGTVLEPYRRTGVDGLRVGTLAGVVNVTWSQGAQGQVERVTMRRAARRLATAVLAVRTDPDPRDYSTRASQVELGAKEMVA